MPRLPAFPAFIALAAFTALSGCDKPDPTSRSATGEVLEGTVSDAMLPADTLTSEPPLAAPAEVSANGAKRKPADDGPAADSTADSAAEPGATPAPEAAPAAAGVAD